MEERNENYFINKFKSFRSGTVILSGGEGIGDLIIFIGRHDTVQHSCILVWLDVDSLAEKKPKVVSHYQEGKTALSFLGLAEGGRYDMAAGEIRKGLILWTPEDLFANAPVVYGRRLNEDYIPDDYVTLKLQEYIDMHHLKMQYAYGKLHIVTAGLGFDVFGPHKDGGRLCSENVYLFLEHLCEYPKFIVGGAIIDAWTYKVPDAPVHLYVPDFFSSSHNNHPVFEQEEYRVISSKNEDDITVKHPYIVAFAVLIIIAVGFFLLVNNYCESCNAKGFCPIGATDIFDAL